MRQIWPKRATVRERKPRNAVTGAASRASVLKVNLAGEKQLALLRRNLLGGFLRILWRQRFAAKALCIAARENQHEEN